MEYIGYPSFYRSIHHNGEFLMHQGPGVTRGIPRLAERGFEEPGGLLQLARRIGAQGEALAGHELLLETEKDMARDGGSEHK